MKILIELTFQEHQTMLASCLPADREYAILKNALLTPYGENSEDPRTVIILCNSKEAKKITALFKRLFPGRALDLRTYITK
jgi:hypothetical protein